MSHRILKSAGIATGLGMAVVTAAWLGLVAPARAKVAAAQAQQAELTKTMEELAVARSATELAANLERLRVLSHAIAARAERPLSQAETYGALTSLAEAHSLTIDRLDPRDTSGARPSREGGPAAASLAYSIILRGPFTKVLCFMSDLERDPGLVRIVSARVQPAGDAQDPACTLTLETRHVSLVASTRSENDR